MANNSAQTSSSQLFGPPIAGSLGSQNYGQPLSMQFRPVVPAQQGQQFMPISSPQFHPAGQGISLANISVPAVQSSSMQYSQPTQQLPPRPGQLTPSPQALPTQFPVAGRPFMSESSQSQQISPAASQVTGLTGSGMPLSSPFTFAPSFGQPQSGVNASSAFHSTSQVHVPIIPGSGQPWLLPGTPNTGTVTPVQQSAQQTPVVAATNTEANISNPVQHSSSDWQEHTSGDGRRYYYNKKTRQSSWEKPLELMTSSERADASTDWKEFTTQDGKKYYYNKVTKQSKWTLPEELKVAREQAEKAEAEKSQLQSSLVTQVPATITVSTAEASVGATTSVATAVISTPHPSVPLVSFNTASNALSQPSDNSLVNPVAISVPRIHPSATVNTELHGITTGGSGPSISSEANATNSTINLSQDSVGDPSMQDIEEAKKGMPVAGRINITPQEVKAVDEETFIYATKQEAKDAFKALLESANVESHWTWDQAMRVIINDKRYGALRTLGERKQAFNEYLGQRKKIEAEERRMKQKRAREEFVKMLEESKELTSSTRWSKAITMFEDDERFKAVERSRDREDLFLNYLDELLEKEKVRAHEELERNRIEYRKFLESCDFIKVTSQWRRIQDRLEDDERCNRLEKIVRLEVFQEYIRDLEKEEEEHKRMQREQLRRSERKNRDEYRKLLEEHVESGVLNAKTHWREYYMKVKDLPQYVAVASNTSGSTPKDLFEDVYEELGKQYDEDKSRIKDALKLGKVTVVSSTSIEDFTASISEDIGSPAISDVNMKLVFEELIDRIKEKEEKEAKRRQLLADDFANLLHSIKEITASSTWDECVQIFEGFPEYSEIGGEDIARDIFEEYIEHLQEKAKERDRKREEKVRKEREREEKERKEKDREREREKGKERSRKDEMEGEDVDVTDNYDYRADKKKDKDRDRKHRRRHHGLVDDVLSDKDDRDDSRKSRRHGSDRKKPRKRSYTPDSESEGRHRKRRRDYRDTSRRNGGYEELEDGELGEDGEIW